MRKGIRIPFEQQQAIDNLANSFQGIVTALRIQIQLKESFASVPSLPQIRRFLKSKLGFTYRKISPITAQQNSARNKKKRRAAAIQYIKLLHAGKRIINVDESVVNCTENRQYSWVKKGSNKIKAEIQRVAGLSIICGVTNRDEIFFTMNRGSNNSMTL